MVSEPVPRMDEYVCVRVCIGGCVGVWVCGCVIEWLWEGEREREREREREGERERERVFISIRFELTPQWHLGPAGLRVQILADLMRFRFSWIEKTDKFYFEGGLHSTVDSILASHQVAPGMNPSIPKIVLEDIWSCWGQLTSLYRIVDIGLKMLNKHI